MIRTCLQHADLKALYGTVTPANFVVSQMNRNSTEVAAIRQLIEICIRNI